MRHEKKWATQGADYFERTAQTHARMRLGLLMAMVFAAFTSIGVRLADISIAVQAEDDREGQQVVQRARHRAELVDRRGTLLARNVDIISVGADPREVWDAVDTAQLLLPYLPNADEDTMIRRLASDRHFVWLQRRITSQQHYDIHNLGLGGIRFVEEPRRIYPHRDSLSHIVGYSNVDGEGLAGLEMAFNEELQGQSAPVATSIDLRIQHALRDELIQAMAEFSAIAAAGVVLDVNTGEVLGMVSLPDYDPHNPAAAEDAARFDRAAGGVYELGSVMKPLTIAHALDLNLIDPETMFDVSRPLEVADFLIRDYHPLREPVSVTEILGESSNIGTARIAEMIGQGRQEAFLREVGLLDRAPVELPGAARPLVPQNWGPVETATISFGHGLSITPLHLAAATAAMVNGGYYIEPTLRMRSDDEPLRRRRVISARTSRQMRAMLRYVVTEGTGGSAEALGYEVAGKTGTSEKPRPGGGYYRDRLISSFVATFPASDPQVLVFAMLDEPQATEDTQGYATGGWTVAPSVSRIIERIAPFAGVMPVDIDERSAASLAPAMIEDPATLSPQ